MSEFCTIIFARGFSKMQKLLNDKKHTSKIKESTYLRTYAYTNVYEFFAVSIEHYIETPLAFKKELPFLYAILKRMLNYEFLK